MRVAIVHYHFKRGGVTRVVESLCRELETRKDAPSVALISGGEPDSDSLADVQFVEGLGYTSSPPFADPRQLLDRVDVAARDALGGPPDLWHLHNPTLGKNAVWSEWIRLLAERGDSLFLQPHDFAEDGRPSNFHYRQSHAVDPRAIFPQRAGIHYGVINRRDCTFLGQLGVPADRLHSLPNPVEPPAAGLGRAIPIGTDRQLVLSPVRALRRKNPGELLLAAATDPQDRYYATSLGPTNPAYRPAYERWQGLARTLDIPAVLGLNETANHRFEDLIATADQIMTTSVGEGFGLGFLEPWLYQKPARGRDLPAITADFVHAGVDLESLYTALPIPVEWLDLDGLRERYLTAARSTLESYGKQVAASQLHASWERWSSGSTIDFGRLDETAQESVLKQVVQGAELPAETLDRLHPAAEPDADLLDANRRRITAAFSPAAYAQSVLDAWSDTLNDAPPDSSPTDWLSPEPLIEAFLDLESTSLLRLAQVS